MDARFLAHNSHLEDSDHFEDIDPQLRRLKTQPLVYESQLLQEFPYKIPGIYTLAGGRQVGKTTLLKQWMLFLLKKKVSPQAIFFISGEVIDDHHALLNTIQNILSEMGSYAIQYLVIDEISYIKDWDKAIKFLADSGGFQNVFVMLTGSDLAFIEEAKKRFPGRRGRADKTDFHLYPLSFREFITLKHPTKAKEMSMDVLFQEFNNFLIHGGYLTAINDFVKDKKIHKSTLQTYSDWIRGDCLKRGKSEQYLKEILSSVIRSYGTQVTWNSLSHHMSIDHPRTVQDYVELLQSMDVLFVQHAIIEDKLLPAPKKAKRLFFEDPFIYHSVREWLIDTIPNNLKPEEQEASLAETVAINSFARLFPTYYIKGAGEVDIAFVEKGKFWPVEVKWTSQIRPKDLKQVLKYKNGIILSKSQNPSTIEQIKTFPLPQYLIKELS